MNTFASAVKSQETRTENGMRALTSTSNNVVDFFYSAGASRGKDIIPKFVGALSENKDLAIRVALWLRDIRGGSGERQLFRNILTYIAKTDKDLAIRLIPKVPELGRWDDLACLIETNSDSDIAKAAALFWKVAVINGNGLASKWCPRKGSLAVKLRDMWELTPKQYRKLIVANTDVVETKMCSKEFDKINFSHVPSVAHSRYKTAFYRNAEEVYKKYVEALVKKDPEQPTAKINAGAIFPYDVIKGAYNSRYWDQTKRDVTIAQWDALENFVGDADILPMVDVSGSMSCPVGGNPNLNCMDVAISLGLYCADKNTGKFKDTFLTFSGNPELLNLQGNIIQKIEQMSRSNWGMNTDIIKAFKKILKVAIDGKVPQEEMPKILVIFSDMAFDQCASFDDSAMESVKRNFEQAGYSVPQIVFWNLNDKGNVPVKSNEQGVALVSGFSPSILKSLLAGDMSEFNPEAIMKKVIMSDRYNY